MLTFGLTRQRDHGLHELIGQRVGSFLDAQRNSRGNGLGRWFGAHRRHTEQAPALHHDELVGRPRIDRPTTTRSTSRVVGVMRGFPDRLDGLGLGVRWRAQQGLPDGPGAPIILPGSARPLTFNGSRINSI